jgi:CPA1 family monovalent cation:H+ antiporter
MIYTPATTEQVSIIVLLLILTMAVALVARSLRVPYTLALVLVGMVLGFAHAFPALRLNPDLVLFLFLPALLFEGAWNVETRRLARDRLVIFLLAVPGLALSLLVIAAVAHWGAGLPWLLALLLGAIVSPTDPIAVLSLLRQLHMPERLLSILDGESLFNDGVGAAAFELALGALLVSLHADGELAGLPAVLVALKALWLLGGGLLIGTALGYTVSHLVRVVDDPLLETTVTFSVAYGAYILGVLAGTSGLLAVVAAGLLLGSYGRRIGMTERTRAMVDHVWEFTGYFANSLLFLLLGVALGEASPLPELPAVCWAVVGVVAGRALVIYVFLPLHDWLARRNSRSTRASGATRLLRSVPVPRAWRPLMLLSGLRGALSLALVLSVPALVPQQEQLKLIVYGVVLVTLVGQGIALPLLLPRFPHLRPAADGTAQEPVL